MTSQLISKLVNFVQTEFGVSDEEVITALRHDDYRAQLPMILWQYGFITVRQLDVLLTWLTQAQMANHRLAADPLSPLDFAED